MNYSSLAFTKAIKSIQDKLGSREAYQRVERMSYVDGFTPVEEEFIRGMDSFYMASIGENGYPYIQHRGGPQGFIKVLDQQTIGLVDFSGNKQYISVGNASMNPNVSLIMVSYPMRSRLKIYAELEIVELQDNPPLFEKLKPEDYKFKAERMMIFHIKAYDWNCPQHITPRYTIPEIQTLMAPKDRQIAQLQQEIEDLRKQLKKNKKI